MNTPTSCSMIPILIGSQLLTLHRTLTGNARVAYNVAVNGGGIHNENKVSMSGNASIVHNYAGSSEGGGGVYNGGEFSISGAPVISENFGGGYIDGNFLVCKDIFSDSMHYLTVGGQLTGGAKIGVEIESGRAGVFTKGLKGNLPAGKAADDIFFSDYEKYGVSPTLTTEGEAQLASRTSKPSFSPRGGNCTSEQNVEINCYDEGATIYYTKDGSEPTTKSAVYSAPIKVSSTTTIKAVAVKEGKTKSYVAEATYTFLYTIVFNANGGSGTMNSQSAAIGDTFTFPECTFREPENKAFDHWEMSGVDSRSGNVDSDGAVVNGKFYPGNTVKIANNCVSEDGNITVTAFWKDRAVVREAPIAKFLIYNGSAQELVTRGNTEGGTINFALGSDDATAPTSGWGTAVPKGTDAGTYYVWYKAVGDNNHVDSKPACCTAKIDKTLPVLTVKPKAITCGQTLAYSSLEESTAEHPVTTTEIEGTFKWTDDTIKPDVSDSDKTEYEVTFTPADTKNYETATAKAKLTVNKPDEPEPPAPSADTVAKISLDAGLAGTSSGIGVTAAWGKVDGATSYEVFATYCSKKNAFKKIATFGGDTQQMVIKKLNGKKLKKKKNVKIYVVAYKTVDGQKVKLAKSIAMHVAGSKNKKYTNARAVTVTKSSYTLTAGGTAKIKAKLVLQKKNRKSLKHEAMFRYATGNAQVAGVDKNGRITAVGKGTCDIYVYANNGISKKITVTVQ